MTYSKLLQPLSPDPVLGVDMGSVALLRLDQCDGLAPGNKRFKLRGNLATARAAGCHRLLSFGGPWSNHLHALAAAGREAGFATVGIVRGDHSTSPSAMLRDASRWGMHLEYVSRAQYRLRELPDYLKRLQEQFGPCLIIPEGGANAAGVEGSRAIARLLPPAPAQGCRVVLPVGTGTTLAGLTLAADARFNVVGVSVLKGVTDIEQRVRGAMRKHGASAGADWVVLHDHHCGGYARVSAPLKEFTLEFERVQGIPLDPVYTAKALFCVHRMLATRQWEGEIIAVHTGGLQGRRGFAWLD